MLTALPVVAGGSLSRLVTSLYCAVACYGWHSCGGGCGRPPGPPAARQSAENRLKECQVAKASAIVENLAATAELHSRRISSASGDTEDILFLTWPVDRFFEVARQVVATYTKELGVKKCLVEEVAMVADSKTLSFYVAAWSYQAYVDDDCRLSLEALVHEVGLK